MTAEVFNIQRFSLFDGPGVRTVVFLKGCPLRCLWCHNPEGERAGTQLFYNADRCIACGACAEVCPRGCHSMDHGLHLFDRSACVDCGACAAECTSLALSVVGQTMTVEQIMEIVLRDKKTYDASGGGLTLSGGEPLAHGEASLALLQAAGAHGLHTCVETSGFGDPELVKAMAACTDLFLFDYKVTGDDLHETLCGVPQTPILENLALLDRLGARVILRCPIIPEYNGTEVHQQGIADTAGRYACVEEIQLEPYHRLGISKAQQLGREPRYDGSVPERTLMEEFAGGLRQRLTRPVPVQIN